MNRIRNVLLAVCIATFVVGCATKPVGAPMDVVVLQGNSMRPIENAEVRVLIPYVGFRFSENEWVARTSSDGVAKFEQVPIEDGLICFVKDGKSEWKTIGGIIRRYRGATAFRKRRIKCRFHVVSRL